MNGKRLVIDASVALKWRLRDEEATDQADALLEDFLAGKLELLTPTLFDYEIANALRVAVTRQRLSEPDAEAALTLRSTRLSGMTSRVSPASLSTCRVNISARHTTVRIWRWRNRRACGVSRETDASSMPWDTSSPGSNGWVTINSTPFQSQTQQSPSRLTRETAPNTYEDTLCQETDYP